MSEFWKGRNVLITGINGFVGSSVADRLLGFDANVTGLLRDFNHKHGGILSNCDIFLGNITDYKLLTEIIASKEIDTVFHFAANAIVRIAANDPLNAYDINVMGTVALLEACRNVGRCRSIIVASSDKAYGDHEILPYNEKTHGLQPNNTYDTSKACVDMIARSFSTNYSMPVCVTRCSNIYGPGDHNFSRIIPNTIKKIIENQRPVLYSDIEKMEREFIYIDDVVDACLLLAENPAKATREAFNVGGTGPVQIRELVKKIGSLMGKDDIDIEIKQRDPLFKEIARQYIDASKLESAVGWTPKVKLNTGLVKSVEWYTDIFMRTHR